jgi:hypothetical protein
MLYHHDIFSSNSAGYVLKRNSKAGMEIEMETISTTTTTKK